MIFSTPGLTEDYLEVLKRLDKLRADLKFATSNSYNRWTGFLARLAYARAIHVSNTMEGINVTLDDAVAAVDREDRLKPQDQDWFALLGYREALDYIVQLAKEPGNYQYNEGTILSLHFMMMKYDLTKHPGRWRPGEIHVTNTASGEVVYNGPPAEEVPGLVKELVEFLNTKSEVHPVIRAAMAHLNLTLIHPFKDGNGRMARALQTMVLAKEITISPVFSSIEEYVGTNVLDYYAVLAEVGQGNWHPENSALPWIKFCLTAHYRQAMTLMRRLQEMSQLFNTLEEETKKRGLNDRVVTALVDAAIGLSVRNPTYRKQAEISNQVAKLDLSALASDGFLVPKGDRRWRHYIASDALKEIRDKTRIQPTNVDPFLEIEKVQDGRQRELPGL